MLRPGWRGLIVLPLLATAGGAWAAHSAQTPQSSPPITVLAGQESIGQWSNRISRGLADGITYPKPMIDRAGPNDYHQGLAKVAFTCGSDGKPTEVRILSSSGAHDLDHAAMVAVQHIATLWPLPDGLQADR